MCIVRGFVRGCLHIGRAAAVCTKPGSFVPALHTLLIGKKGQSRQTVNKYTTRSTWRDYQPAMPCPLGPQSIAVGTLWRLQTAGSIEYWRLGLPLIKTTNPVCDTVCFREKGGRGDKSYLSTEVDNILVIIHMGSLIINAYRYPKHRYLCPTGSGLRYMIVSHFFACQCVFWLAQRAKKCDKIWYLGPLPNVQVSYLILK